MISQKEFIESVQGKKETAQGRFVKIMRWINHIFPVKIVVSQDKPKEYLFVTICRKSDFDMVAASVYSLYKNSYILPNKVVIVSDGTWMPDDGIAYFKKYGITVECTVWDMCASYYRESCPSLYMWAKGHIWGKKMASILYYSEQYKVLFSDPDILWYGTPLSETEIENCKLKLSIDNSHNYDDAFIKEWGFERLYDTLEPINCGAVFISGGLSLLSKDALKCINYEAEHLGPFAEQTVFAIMDLDFNYRWSMKQITSEISDMIQSFSSKTIKYENMIARHYLWRLKWIYWKDFFLMRMHNAYNK